MSILTSTTTTVQADAKQRTVRTLLVGFVTTVVTAVYNIVIPAFQNGLDKVDWTRLGSSAATVAIMTAFTYVLAKVVPALNQVTVDPAPVAVPVEFPAPEPVAPAAPDVPAVTTPVGDAPTFTV